MMDKNKAVIITTNEITVSLKKYIMGSLIIPRRFSNSNSAA